jgi:hypothetical protein
MKLNRLVLVSLIGISLSTPAWACEPGSGGGIFSFFHHDCDKDKDHHDHDGGKSSHGGDCNGGGHSGSGGSNSGGGSSSGGGSGTPTTPGK